MPRLSKENQPAEGRETGEEPRGARVFPEEVEMIDQPRDEDDIEGALTDDLVRDVHIATFGVLSLRHGGQGSAA